MERHSNIKWETMREALLDTTIPYVISLIIFIVTFFRGVRVTPNSWTREIGIVLCLSLFLFV